MNTVLDNPGIQAEEYDRQWAELDDFIRFNPGARHRRRLIWTLLKRLPFSTVLDVGCGPGETLLYLAQRRPEVRQYRGVDFAPQVIARNRERYPAMRFDVLNIEQEALAGETFDLVVCSEVIEHLNERKEGFANLARMVRPGGHLMVTCPTGKVYVTERYFGHVSHPTRREVLALAAANGLTLKRLRQWGWPAYTAVKIATNINSEWSIHNFGSGSYGALKLLINEAIYLGSFLSFPSSPLGCQIVALFHKGG